MLKKKKKKKKKKRQKGIYDETRIESCQLTYTPEQNDPPV